MPAYRVYRLDGDGRISGADWIEAAADDSALEEAQRQSEGSSRYELWQGSRLVGRILDEPPSPPIMPPSRREA